MQLHFINQHDSAYISATVKNLKESFDLARNYGLDISMPEVNFALSGAAHREYQKRCSGLYKEFQKNINSIMKDEEGIRDVLRKLKKEKVCNSKYSLYRSSGSGGDLFSKATKKRKQYMENNLATVSPLLDELCETPWGLDPIIDEDLVRPQTAPPNQQAQETDANEPVKEALRPYTAVHVDLPTTTEPSADVPRNSSSVKQVEVTIPESKIAQIDRLLKGLQKSPPDGQTQTNPDDGDDFSDADGEVDPSTERTRARKITINAGKFAQLQNGKTLVKLRDKNGEFILKPLNINYEPTEVEAVFFAKDPTKEKMALVRQNTSWKSQTVSSDLKVNNRLAIQKSLMGQTSKKTTVAEIFNNARDRRTRHFRIMLKNPLVTYENEDNNKRGSIGNTSATGKNRKLSRPNIESKQVQKITPSATKLVAPATNLQSATQPSKNLRKTILRDTSTPHAEKQKKLQIVISAAEDVPPDKSSPSQPLFRRRRISITSQDLDNAEESVIQQMKSGKVAFGPDSHGHPDRSQSSLSVRDGVQIQMSDTDMTEMIRRLVEGKTDNDANTHETKTAPSNRKVLRPPGLKPGLKRKPQGGSDTGSNAGSARSFFSTEHHRPPARRIDAKNIIRDAMRKDQEYEEALVKMRRRVALGSGLGARRPNSVAAFR